MAERKPLFMANDGYYEEMATSDTATFGGLTLEGPIDMQGYKIVDAGAATAVGTAVALGVSAGKNVHIFGGA